MTLAARLLLLTFVESFSTVLLERGLYFYTHERLAFSDRENLALAFAFGALYVLGALTSHRLTRRASEKRLLIALLALLFASHALLVVRREASFVVVAFLVTGVLHGLKWPLVESFYSAGHSPSALATALGRFNVAWAVAVPLAVAASGPLIASRVPATLFVVAAALNVISLAVCAGLPNVPPHREVPRQTPANAPEQGRTARLLGSTRWSLLGGYTLMFLLAPLMPTIFARLGLAVGRATVAASLLDVVRVVCFGVLGAWIGWRGRGYPLLLAALALPVAFTMIAFGPTLGIVLAGEVLFGAANGVSYAAALYYALVMKNGSVQAGGVHESFVGAGFALGPLAGLCSSWLASASSLPNATALMLSVAPLGAACLLGAVFPLLRRRAT